MYDFSAVFQDERHQPFLWEGSQTYCAILVHGFPGTPCEMRSAAEVLHNQGWTVHGLLLPGFGIEIHSLVDKSYTDWLSTILNTINQYKQKYDKVILVGHSMGGALSVQAAVSSDIDGLLLLAPFWKIEHVLWTLLPGIRLILPTFKPFKIIRPDFDDPNFKTTLGHWLPSADLSDPYIQAEITDFAIPTNMINQIRIAGNHARQAVAHISVPTTVIQGRQDELVKPELTQTLVQHMTTDVNYLLIDGDHNLTDCEKPHWNEVSQLIEQFAIEFEQRNK